MIEREIMERLEELERKLDNILIPGVVYKVNKNHVRVKSGDVVTGWLNVFQPAAGDDQIFNPISKKEQVLAVFPGGVMENGYALRGVVYDSKPLASEATDKVFVKKFSDGTKITYDKESHELNADVKGKIVVKNYDNIEVETAAEMSFKNGISELKIGLGTIELKGLPGPTFGVLTEMSKCPVFGVSLVPQSMSVKASL